MLGKPSMAIVLFRYNTTSATAAFFLVETVQDLDVARDVVWEPGDIATDGVFFECHGVGWYHINVGKLTDPGR